MPSLRGVVGRARGFRERLNLRFRARELPCYAIDAARRGSALQPRVVIFAQGRTGSTLLENLLASTGHFRAHGELLICSPGEVLFPHAYVRGHAKRHGSDGFIFHVKIYQLTRDRRHPVDPRNFLSELSAEGWKIIHLRRRNKLRHGLSNLVAQQRGAYHRVDERRDPLRMHVNCERLVTMIRQRILFDRAEDQCPQGLPSLPVVYEDDLEHPECQQRTVNRILDWLSLPRRPATTSYKKVVDVPLHELVENHPELAACVEREGWRRFLDP